jgi:NADH-quinone oxidoreductase subunit N
MLSGKGERYQNIDDFAGLGQKQPLTAAMFSIFLLSLIGVPLTGGFFGKFYIFKAALESHLVWLTVLGLLNSAVAAYYYLRILVMMYMHEPGEAVENAEPLVPRPAHRADGARARHPVPGHLPHLGAGVRGKSAAMVK